MHGSLGVSLPSLFNSIQLPHNILQMVTLAVNFIQAPKDPCFAINIGPSVTSLQLKAHQLNTELFVYFKPAPHAAATTA